MAKYCFPAVMIPVEDGGYSVRFPDIENCFTCGDTLEEALEMAEDVLNMMLVAAEDEKRAIPMPSDHNHIALEVGEFVTFVRADTVAYRKATDGRAIKKTLTIPSWLNQAAERAGVNFSQTLQEALQEKLGYT